MAGRMDGAVLATIWSLILPSLPRQHQVFEFFKPVEDDDRFRRCGCLLCLLGFLDHQESLAEYTYGFRCSWK